MDSFWDFFWFILSFFLLMAYLMVLFQILGDLFRDKDTSGWVKAVWIFFLIFLPILTSLIYLIATRPGDDRAQHRRCPVRPARPGGLHPAGLGRGASPADQIAQAKGLLDSGAISAEEFEALKAKALA